MSLLPLVHTDIREVNQLQNNVAQALNPVTENPIVNGIYLTGTNGNGVSLASGTNVINHKLGRKALGCFIAALSNSSTAYVSLDSFTATTITIVTSGAVRAFLYIF